MRCICATSVFLAGNSERNGVGIVVVFKNLFTLQTFKYFKHNDFDRSPQFLVHCFEKIVLQKTIADLIQPTCLLVSEERRVRDRSGKAKN